MFDGSPAVTRPKRRLFILFLLVVALFVTLVARLWALQIRSGDTYAAAAQRNEVRTITVPAPRGQILDDMGRPLVDNQTGLVVRVDRTVLESQPDKGADELSRLAGVLGISVTDLQNKLRLCNATTPKPCWNGSPYQPVPVTDAAGTQQALQIMEEQERFPGVTAEPEAVLHFPAPYGVNAAQILGYTSPATQDEIDKSKQQGAVGAPVNQDDQVGAAGLEATYDPYLRGADGTTQLTVDNHGRVIGTTNASAPTPGDYLVTSIDARVQAAAEQQLLAAIQRARSTPDTTGGSGTYKADSGAVVVLNVRTGQVVAMASYPTYDPSVWVNGISQQEFDALQNPANGTPLIDRAYQGQFPPGSTFKVVSTSAAGMDGFNLNGTYDCSGTFQIGGVTLNNFESEAFGPISLKRAIEVSCDTVFYGIAYQMWLADGGNKPVANPKDPIQNMALAYGLGSKTGLDLPGEAPGQVSDRQTKKAMWDKYHDSWCANYSKYPPGSVTYQILKEDCEDGYVWRGGDAVNESIGQSGILLTPLQLARVYAAVANGGTLYTPTIGKAIISPDGKVVKTIGPTVAGHVPVDSQTLSFLHDALVGTATEGTGAIFGNFPMSQIPIAAKTGTAEAPNGQQTESWFASYAPANNPQYAVVMTVTQGGTGSGTSGPSVDGIYRALYGVNQQGQFDPKLAALPFGAPPAGLPTVRPDGTIAQIVDYYRQLGADTLSGDGGSGAVTPVWTELPPADAVPNCATVGRPPATGTRGTDDGSPGGGRDPAGAAGAVALRVAPAARDVPDCLLPRSRTAPGTGSGGTV